MTWFIVWAFLISSIGKGGTLQTPPQFADKATCDKFVEEHAKRMEDFFRGRFNASFEVEINAAGACVQEGTGI